MCHKFLKAVKLTVNERAKGSAPNQEKFRTILTNLRDGESTVDDWNLLLSRTPNNVENLQLFKDKCIKLSCGNDKVAQDNYDKLKELNKPIAEVNARQNNSSSRKLSADN